MLDLTSILDTFVNSILAAVTELLNGLFAQLSSFFSNLTIQF